jgi:predicted nucleic acid-binding protein
MRPALFDSSVYIAAFRRGDEAVVALRRISTDAPLWMSSVVLEELYAGADSRERPLVERMERDYERIKRILVPNLSDWTRTGRVLRRLAEKYGFERIGQSRLTNDALIAMSAGRLGIRVFTANQRDYRRLAEFRAFEWRIVGFWTNITTNVPRIAKLSYVARLLCRRRILRFCRNA